MEREFFFEETQEELAQSVCATLSETSGACWRMERWGDMRWHVVRETTEEEIRWLKPGVGDMSDWLRMSAETWFDHRVDADLADMEPGDEAADWRNAEVQSAEVKHLAAGEMATFHIVVGKGETEVAFRIDIHPAYPFIRTHKG